jgi:hypothetical protein
MKELEKKNINMKLQEQINRIQSMMGVINEDRFKGYKRFLKNNVFTNFPDYVINDMFRETGDLDYKDIQGMSKDEIINYFHNGDGKRFFERYGDFEKKDKPRVIEIKWDDLVEPLQRFLKNKMSGENPNFPDSRERLLKTMENSPNLGKGINEPIILKYNSEGKIEDIVGGNHRTYAAFELNNFNPIKMRAYIIR